MADHMREMRAAIAEIKASWRNADDDQRVQFVLRVAGWLMMGFSIIAFFGFWGALFCTGYIFYYRKEEKQ